MHIPTSDVVPASGPARVLLPSAEIPSALGDVAATPDGAPPVPAAASAAFTASSPDSSGHPPRLTLRTLTSSAVDPGAEDLSPTAPDPDVVEGELLESADAPVVELKHDPRAAEPEQRPAEEYLGTHVVFRLSVVLPLGDSRIPSMDLLLRRARAVIDGELLTPVEKVEGQFSGSTPIGRKAAGCRTAQQLAEQRREKAGACGRPRLARRGIVKTHAGDEFAFHNLLELSHLIGAAYSNITTKYRAACAKAGVDPDDNDGVTFHYKDDVITVTTR